ncbi:hypothetical protein AB0878_44880 [Amycolatopsis sp. NPDC047767]|uniref:hypothetical protein n=1 Tax=Amycolatopsis sp. NPDC047767 TaxID=3156765 RepID=UPI003453BCC5
MTESEQPPIPLALAHLPVVGGLVVPWITPRTPDSRYLLGTVDVDRMNACLQRRRCGVCGRDLVDRTVLLLRLSDLPRACTNEPGLHPVCAAYTIKACPMVGGRMTQYRRSPRLLGPEHSTGPDAQQRLGAPREPWFSVWVGSYDLIEADGNLAASYAKLGALRVRPINWLLPGLM